MFIPLFSEAIIPILSDRVTTLSCFINTGHCHVQSGINSYVYISFCCSMKGKIRRNILENATFKYLSLDQIASPRIQWRLHNKSEDDGMHVCLVWIAIQYNITDGITSYQKLRYVFHGLFKLYIYIYIYKNNIFNDIYIYFCWVFRIIYFKRPTTKIDNFQSKSYS